MPMEDTLSLVSRAREGSSKALEDLLQANLPGLRAFIAKRAGDLVIARDSVTDVVQSTCREVLQALPDHDYENEVHFRHWLYQTALRKIVDRSRYWTAQRRDVAREVPIGDRAVSTRFMQRPPYAGCGDPTPGVPRPSTGASRVRRRTDAFCDGP
jgi:DNA-directed RNA polymerase specialized sigma24 family protein